MVLGSEYITFTSDEETFYDIQYKQLAYLTFAYDEGLHYDYIKTLDWDKIRRIARETWFV